VQNVQDFIIAQRGDKVFRYLYSRGQWQELKSWGWEDIDQEGLFRG
jgi:hypothetical protein